MCEELYNRPGAKRITVSGLSEHTDYEFYVAFVNSAGCSQATGPQHASTGTVVLYQNGYSVYSHTIPCSFIAQVLQTANLY